MGTLDITLLRIIHIVGGVVWVGFGLFLVAIVLPAMQNTGQAGSRFYAGMLKVAPIGRIMGVASLLTTIAGLWLYVRLYGHSILPTIGGYVLVAGSIAGVLAFGHGLGAMAPATGKQEKAVTALVEAGNAADDAMQKKVDTLTAKVLLHGRISAGLTVFALVCMASARYLM